MCIALKKSDVSGYSKTAGSCEGENRARSPERYAVHPSV